MSTSKTGRNVAIAGVVCQLGLVVGLAGAMVAVKGAYETLGNNPGMGDPAAISESIGLSFVIGFIGLILLAVSVTACRYRAEWFFWFLVVYEVLALSVFPVGTAFGVFFLAYCLTKRQEFLRPSKVPPQPC